MVKWIERYPWIEERRKEEKIVTSAEKESK